MHKVCRNPKTPYSIKQAPFPPGRSCPLFLEQIFIDSWLKTNICFSVCFFLKSFSWPHAIMSSSLWSTEDEERPQVSRWLVLVSCKRSTLASWAVRKIIFAAELLMINTSHFPERHDFSPLWETEGKKRLQSLFLLLGNKRLKSFLDLWEVFFPTGRLCGGAWFSFSIFYRGQGWAVGDSATGQIIYQAPFQPYNLGCDVPSGSFSV